jgi:ribosomal protein S8E
MGNKQSFEPRESDALEMTRRRLFELTETYPETQVALGFVDWMTEEIHRSSPAFFRKVQNTAKFKSMTREVKAEWLRASFMGKPNNEATFEELVGTLLLGGLPPSGCRNFASMVRPKPGETYNVGSVRVPEPSEYEATPPPPLPRSVLRQHAESSLPGMDGRKIPVSRSPIATSTTGASSSGDARELARLEALLQRSMEQRDFAACMNIQKDIDRVRAAIGTDLTVRTQERVQSAADAPPLPRSMQLEMREQQLERSIEASAGKHPPGEEDELFGDFSSFNLEDSDQKKRKEGKKSKKKKKKKKCRRDHQQEEEAFDPFRGGLLPPPPVSPVRTKEKSLGNSKTAEKTLVRKSKPLPPPAAPAHETSSLESVVSPISSPKKNLKKSGSKSKSPTYPPPAISGHGTNSLATSPVQSPHRTVGKTTTEMSASQTAKEANIGADEVDEFGNPVCAPDAPDLPRSVKLKMKEQGQTKTVKNSERTAVDDVVYDQDCTMGRDAKDNPEEASGLLQ